MEERQQVTVDIVLRVKLNFLQRTGRSFKLRDVLHPSGEAMDVLQRPGNQRS